MNDVKLLMTRVLLPAQPRVLKSRQCVFVLPELSRVSEVIRTKKLSVWHCQLLFLFLLIFEFNISRKEVHLRYFKTSDEIAKTVKQRTFEQAMCIII